MGYRRYFSHSAENSHRLSLFTSAFELESFPHLHHAIVFQWISFHSMLWVEIPLAWHHLSHFSEGKIKNFCCLFQMICLLKWFRDSWLFDSFTRVVHQKGTTHLGHLASAGELCPQYSQSNRFCYVFQWFSLSQIAGRQCSNGSSLEPLGHEGDYFSRISMLPFRFAVEDFIFLLANMNVYFFSPYSAVRCRFQALDMISSLLCHS